MEMAWMVLILIAALWVFNLVVFGILAIIYHYKHTPLIQERNDYYKQWKNYKSSVCLKELFRPLLITYELPKDEHVYYLDVENLVYVYSKKTQEYKSLRKIEGKYPNFAENYFDDFDITSLKSSFNLGFKEAKTPFIGDLYISNKRILIKESKKEKSYQIPINNLSKAYIAMIYVGKRYARGYVIQTNNELYEIVSNNPEAVLIINEFLRKRENESGNAEVKLN